MKKRLATLGKAIARALGIEYRCFRVFSLEMDSLPEPNPLPPGYRCAEVTGDEVREAMQPTIQGEAWYCGEDSLGFGVYFGSELVALQWVWFGDGYRRRRNFWPLERNEAKSVELVTAPEHRGLGLATCLKQFSARQLAAKGFVRVFTSGKAISTSSFLLIPTMALPTTGVKSCAPIHQAGLFWWK